MQSNFSFEDLEGSLKLSGYSVMKPKKPTIAKSDLFQPAEGLGMKQQGYGNSGCDKIVRMASKKSYTAIESFCGAGGMSLGLEWAGFNLLHAFDFDEHAVKTHNENLGNKCSLNDAREVTASSVLAHIGRRKKTVDLFAGGPPCQGFSKQKRGAHLGDERNKLVSEFIRLAKEFRPRFFLFENVAIFGQKRGRPFLREMEEELSDYLFCPAFYNSADFGLPQTRERFILVGSRRDQKCTYTIPEATVLEWRTVNEVLEGLPSPPLDYSIAEGYPNHQRARVTKKNIERFSYVPQGGGWTSIPNKLRLDCHKNADTSSGGWPDVYGRLEGDGQCPTITGGFDSFTRGRYGHPVEDRPITPREAARIQGFPDKFSFSGTRADVRKQIGNVVPPPLAEAIGIEILRCLMCSDGLIEDKRSKVNHQLRQTLFFN